MTYDLSLHLWPSQCPSWTYHHGLGAWQLLHIFDSVVPQLYDYHLPPSLLASDKQSVRKWHKLWLHDVSFNDHGDLSNNHGEKSHKIGCGYMLAHLMTTLLNFWVRIVVISQELPFCIFLYTKKKEWYEIRTKKTIKPI